MNLVEDIKSLSDAELVNRTLDKDKEFFGELVDRYSARIFRYLNRLLSRNKADAQECLSETFLKAYLYLSTYNTRLSFSSWLYRIAHNQAIDLMRKNGRRPTQELEEHHAIYHPVSDYTDKDALERSLDQLNVDDRNILILFYLEELTLQEISDMLKMKANTVAVRIKRAKEKIKAQDSLL